LLLSQFAEAQFTTPPVLVGSPAADLAIRNGKLAIDATGTVHIAWEQETPPGGLFSRVSMYAHSVNGGLSFSAPIPVPGAGAERGFLGGLAVNPHGVIFLTETSKSLESGPDQTIRGAQFTLSGDAGACEQA